MFLGGVHDSRTGVEGTGSLTREFSRPLIGGIGSASLFLLGRCLVDNTSPTICVARLSTLPAMLTHLAIASSALLGELPVPGSDFFSFRMGIFFLFSQGKK